MSRIRHRHRRKPASVELNITAFMNLMVVLVPFLLMTAVFSHLTILELNLPDGASKAGNDKPGFQIQIIINKNSLLVADSKGGLIKRIPVTDKSDKPYFALRETLKQIKARLPDKTDATILSQADTPYDTLVKVMDTVRIYPAQVDGEMVNAELFPDISIGDAPKLK
ncbi:Biopolymer transport protein ExbD/TolR [hydrothermal vent metagenome]|uniref:Biopolymer transport protein ExbD/TolR n=1 Tax=hydrothermal vent metagenome TaxID=652676 RepID=A0A3B1AHL8_9ZZZZ